MKVKRWPFPRPAQPHDADVNELECDFYWPTQDVSLYCPAGMTNGERYDFIVANGPPSCTPTDAEKAEGCRVKVIDAYATNGPPGSGRAFYESTLIEDARREAARLIAIDREQQDLSWYEGLVSA